MFQNNLPFKKSLICLYFSLKIRFNIVIYQILVHASYKIDVVDLCINPLTGVNVVKEAKELGIDKVLIQPGAESEDIIDYCNKNGITAIEGCALVELSFYKKRK